MNKKLKRIIVFINLIMLFIAGHWFIKEKNSEPLFAIFGQVAALLLLLFEEKASKVFTKNIFKSKVKIKKEKGDNIHTENVDNSDIDIR